MKFKSGTRRRAAEYEKDLLGYWHDNDTFRKSIENRPTEGAFVFYDGPPFLTGTPHHGHLLISTVKDCVARYQTMKGRRVERRWGWDCHGLPAEVFVEKSLGITSKKEIGTKISIPEYVKACRSAMVKTGTEWEDTIERIGRWVEFEDAYKTMDAEYMESVWWAFKKLYDEGKVYEGEKILVYCTKDATPISKSEVAMENSYRTVTDPSIYTYFKLEGSNDEYMLAWTTTPWTLPANVALAVHPDLDYSLVEHDGRNIYVAQDALERVFRDEKGQGLDYSLVKTVKGTQLAGKRYHPLFENHGPQAHRVLSADFVSADEGSGIVHEAPAYGEEDYELSRSEGVPILSIVDENGNYTEGRWIGQNIWEANKDIAKTLLAEGKALKIEYIQHEYPHCHRCGTKLMYRAHPSWFMDIQGQKDQMLAANDSTNWTPKHLQTGRFRNIIESAPDWNLSRDRYWATPLPIWKGTTADGVEVVKVVGSYDEFEELTGKRLDDYHLPQVMDVEFEVDGVKLKHIGKVIDCWFESGSMPFAQFHYPFENKEKFEKSFPADFIIEAIDQTRGWFYSLTAVNVGLFNSSPFKNLICTGFINAADGKKMSKKLGNYTDPMELMDQYSVDSFRFLLLQSPLLSGEDFALRDKDVGDAARKLSMIWNMYDFFTMYAEVDGWGWDNVLDDPMDGLEHVLDKWIVSRVHQLAAEVDKNMSAYDISAATRPIMPFVDDASNWFVRRSRKRFWKSDDDQDKQQAYRTLHYVLVRLSMILAPFTPFLSEELYRQLTGGESVHLLDWPEAGEVDETLLQQMADVRAVINEGLSQRAAAGIKVRQPLGRVEVKELKKLLAGEYFDEFTAIIAEELNVKGVVDLKAASDQNVQLDTAITDELRQEGVAREIVRHVQSARKKANLKVDDRIRLGLQTENVDIRSAIEHFDEMLRTETLAVELTQDKLSPAAYQEEVEVDGAALSITLNRKA
jgi:isoleucyl-tRNA synthetase